MLIIVNISSYHSQKLVVLRNLKRYFTSLSTFVLEGEDYISLVVMPLSGLVSILFQLTTYMAYKLLINLYDQL